MAGYVQQVKCPCLYSNINYKGMLNHQPTSCDIYSFILVMTQTQHFEDWHLPKIIYVGWNFNSGNYLFTTDTK